MTSKLSINLTFLLHHRTIESEGVEHKAGWNPETMLSVNKVNSAVWPILASAAS